ncbi:hypothetical protein MPH47_21065 [Psychrobacillus psychrodurans]|uniref:hypothetical protein n=1 Tax=Psychrobacillus psychrodurans TaxID=126157 RepID=UPI001F4D515A|nr:hypothetical protein [Psychrobacillus psychrodurans]MCK1999682.1 hypothetical protein [Psychrobacillus psychrodurans]
MIWLIILIILFIIIAFAYLVDRRNKKINNNNQNPVNSNAKPGESSNHMMGDNRYTNGE